MLEQVFKEAGFLTEPTAQQRLDKANILYFIADMQGRVDRVSVELAKLHRLLEARL